MDKEFKEWSAWKGEHREKRFASVLEQIKSEGKIVDFLKTGKFSKADRGGIDFYVVIIKNGKRIFLPLSVSGPGGVWYRKNKNPSIPVVPVDVFENPSKIRDKILSTIDLYLKNLKEEKE